MAQKTNPCAFCGHPDARHRVWDAIRDRFLAGESLEALRLDYGIDQEDVERYLRLALTTTK